MYGFVGLVLLCVGLIIGWFGRGLIERKILSPLSSKQSTVAGEKPLDRYSFDRLRNTKFTPTEIKLERVLNEANTYTSHLFTYLWEGKKISGLANIPGKSGNLPVIIMLRGYVDKEEYHTGVGTSRAAEIFAQNGYITLAPDFLGYGQSDPGSASDLEDRFSNPSQVLQLLASVETISQADTSRIGMWGHSNGGQIALSVLESTGETLPTTLWAPVSKPFPYSVLYYTDEFSDGGRYLRRMVVEFEDLYNSDKYSVVTFFDAIASPVQIHQGGADDAVPQQWSDELVEKLKDLDKDVVYYTYPAADHNMAGSWDTVVNRDVLFFNKHL